MPLSASPLLGCQLENLRNLCPRKGSPTHAQLFGPYESHLHLHPPLHRPFLLSWPQTEDTGQCLILHLHQGDAFNKVSSVTS